MDIVTTALIWFSAISAGIMAGVYFTFSVFAMRSFADLGDEAGARAMQVINRVIQQSAFLPLFFLSTLTCAALVVLGVLGMAGARPEMAIAGGGVYVLGMFVVTALGNVPLNNTLDGADPSSEEGKAVWGDYLTRWTRLNHVRTLACTVSMALLIAALG